MAQWNPDHEQALEALQPTLERVHDELRSRLSADAYAPLDELMQSAAGLMCVAHLYFDGFERVRAGGLLAQSTINPVVRQWVGAGSRNRSAWTIAATVAMITCATLEQFLKAEARIVADPDALRRGHPNWQLSKDRVAAMEAIANKVKPSARQSGTQWMAAVRAVFGCDLAPAIAETLAALVDFRHEVTHEHRPPAEGGPFTGPTGEQIKSWLMATQMIGRATLLAHAGIDPRAFA